VPSTTVTNNQSLLPYASAGKEGREKVLLTAHEKTVKRSMRFFPLPVTGESREEGEA
jgi:hypothetical protein